MAIRCQSLFDDNIKMYQGFIDMGRSISSDAQSLPLAKNALVYLVSGVNEAFKIPVGYFLVNKLKTNEKAALTHEMLKCVSETGLKLIGMTFDGDPTNISTVRLLGAKFNDDKPYIYDPIEVDRKIHIFLDAAHTIKLARNTLGNKEFLMDGQGRKIDWKHIQLLYDTQQTLEWNLGNKLTKVHMTAWFKKKMNVKLACQTLSGSVARSLKSLKGRVDGFEEVDGTAEYLNIMNDIFDIMNSNKSDGVGFKRCISKSTRIELFDRFKIAMEYIKELRIQEEAN